MYPEASKSVRKTRGEPSYFPVLQKFKWEQWGVPWDCIFLTLCLADCFYGSISFHEAWLSLEAIIPILERKTLYHLDKSLENSLSPCLEPTSLTQPQYFIRKSKEVEDHNDHEWMCQEIQSASRNNGQLLASHQDGKTALSFESDNELHDDDKKRLIRLDILLSMMY